MPRTRRAPTSYYNEKTPHRGCVGRGQGHTHPGREERAGRPSLVRYCVVLDTFAGNLSPVGCAGKRLQARLSDIDVVSISARGVLTNSKEEYRHSTRTTLHDVYSRNGDNENKGSIYMISILPVYETNLMLKCATSTVLQYIDSTCIAKLFFLFDHSKHIAGVAVVARTSRRGDTYQVYFLYNYKP